MTDRAKDLAFYESLRLSTSIEKSFKKTNPKLLYCYMALPQKLRMPSIYLFAEIQKDIYYQKNFSPDIWSKKTIDPHEIMAMCSNKFSSENTVKYYRNIVKELVSLNVFYEYRYPFSQRDGLYVRLFSAETEIYQWKYWDTNTPILPATAIKILKSHEEVCKKTAKIINQIDKKVTLEKIKTHFASHFFNNIVSNMSPSISSQIKPFCQLKSAMSVDVYLNEYLTNIIFGCNKFEGLPENTKTKILEDHPQLSEILLGTNFMQAIFAQDVKEKQCNERSSKDNQNDPCSIETSAVKALSISDLRKDDSSYTDNKILISNNSLNIIINNEYNKETEMKEDKKSKRDGKAETKMNTEACKSTEMNIQDIEPKNNGSFKKIMVPKKTKNETKKTYRKHIDGFPYDEDLNGNIADNERVFIRFFRNTICKYNKGIDFSSDSKNYAFDNHGTKMVLDDLMKIGCKDETVIKEWIEWYAQVFLRSKKIDSKFLRVYGFRQTWKDFDKVRRKEMAKVVSITKPVNDNQLFNEVDNIFKNNICSENITKSLGFFGVVITANYLLRKNMKISDIIEQIDVIINSIRARGNKSILAVSIFNSTCKYTCDESLASSVLMSDWVTRYQDFWKENGCSYEHYKSNKILIGLKKEESSGFFRTEN